VAATATVPDVNNATRRSADLSLLIRGLNVQSLTNKTDAVSKLIVDRSLVVLALTETWHSASNDARLRLTHQRDMPSSTSLALPVEVAASPSSFGSI